MEPLRQRLADRFSFEELTDMMLIFGEVRQNERAASALYAERFPDRDIPQHYIFPRLRDRLRATGTFKDPRQGGNHNAADRPVGVPEAIALVRAQIDDDPHTSVRAVARNLEIPKSTVHNIVKKDLRYHPYKKNEAHELVDGNAERRLAMCEFILDKVDEYQNNPRFEGDNFVNGVLWTDECTFTNEGCFNDQNEHHYSPKGDNPHCIIVTSVQHKFKVNVWAGILYDRVIGPVFIEGNVTAQSYTNFLENELDDFLEEIPLAVLRQMWYQQDGHPAHTARTSTNVLNQKFPGRWIGIRSPVQEWPARFPEAAECDFYLWPTIKQRIFATPPQNVAELRQRISDACRAITPEEIQRVHQGLLRRVGLCIREGGGRFQHFL